MDPSSRRRVRDPSDGVPLLVGRDEQRRELLQRREGRKVARVVEERKDDILQLEVSTSLLAKLCVDYRIG